MGRSRMHSAFVTCPRSSKDTIQAGVGWRHPLAIRDDAPRFSPGVVFSGETTMPFSSLRDPTDLARAYAVMDAAWRELKDAIPEDRAAEERTRLAYLVASLTPLALDEDDLKQNVLLQFRQRASETIGV